MRELSLPPPFLDTRQIAKSAAEAELDSVAIQTLQDLARRISADPALLQPALAAYQRVFETNDDYREATQQADLALGVDADVLHALYVLDSTRIVRERHAARGVPPENARAVNQRHGLAWLSSAVAQHGRIGIADWMPGWLRTVASGHLYRLGRLEFVPRVWDYPFRAYRSVQTDELILLAESGQCFTDAGRLGGSPSWTSSLTERDDAIVGNPITAQGVALSQCVRLPRDTWQIALGPGDPVLDLHVPAEGALTIAALQDALSQAEPFFSRFYPDHHFVAYVCDSWLFSAQLEMMLGPDSNIVRWQRESYLLPGGDDQESFLDFTFGLSSIDPATAPRDTRLRRAVVAFLEQGGTLQSGVALLMRADLSRFGTQQYRVASAQAIAHLALLA